MSVRGQNTYSTGPALHAIVADDDPENLDVVASLLRQDGFLVNEAASGEDLWDLVNDGTPAHLVITDLQMGAMSGLDVLSRMQGQHSKIPVILMTGLAVVQLHSQALLEGAVAVLCKPFSAVALRELIATHVSRA